MATVKATITTREQWNQRALELARAKHLDGAARLVADGQAARVYDVPTGDRRGDRHTVRLILVSGEARCDCRAGAFSRPCGHAGAVVHAEAQREAAKNEPDDRMALWLMGFDW